MHTDLLKEYRTLDDTINMRLNRTNAQFRDRDREGKTKGNVQDEACTYLWKSLVGMFLPTFPYCRVLINICRKLETTDRNSFILCWGSR
jgi:hypothetical protein